MVSFIFSWPTSQVVLRKPVAPTGHMADFTEVCEDDGLSRSYRSVTEPPQAKNLQTASDSATGSAIVVFRVSHKHPHRLKRPLQHSDSLTGAEFAVRFYKITEHNIQHGGQQLTVQRASCADVQLVDLFGRAKLKPENIVKYFLQWSVDPALRFEAGVTGCGC